MLRVTHVIGRMAPGGTEHQLAGMIQEAHGRLWEATLCVLSKGWKLTRDVEDAGVRTVELDGSSRLDPSRAPRFRQLIRGADVVHASLWGANAFARLTTIGMPAAIVVSERGVEDHRGWARRTLDRGLRLRTDAYIGNSPAVTDFIRTWHRLDAPDPRVVEVRNGIDTTVFHPNRSADRSHARIVVVGRLVPDKRVDMIITVLPSLLERSPVEVMIAGEGPDRPRLTAMAEGLPVRFLGHIAGRAELAAVMRSSTVLAMPSVSEGLPNAVIEARACGLRVVAADIPGIRPLAGPGVELVGNDPGAWVDALAEAISAGPLGTSDTVDGVRSFEQVAKDHLAVFEAAVDYKTGRRRR